MKYFIGAKDKTGIAFIADIIIAENFEAAITWLDQTAKEKKGEGNYRLTACNELPSVPGVFEVLDESAKPGAKPKQWSMLRIVDLPPAPGSKSKNVDVDLQIAHSTKWESAEEAAKSPSARLISIAYRLVDALLKGKINPKTRVQDFYGADSSERKDADKPLIILPGRPELESSSGEEP